MSDGPHSTLPLNRYWKDVLKKAEHSIFSLKEICDAFTHALKKEVSKPVLKAVCKISEETNVSLLSSNEQFQKVNQRFNAIREKYRGSVPNNILLDHAVGAVLEKQGAERLTEEMLKSSFEEIADANLRDIEEHCFRETSMENSAFIRDRLYEARKMTDISSVASEAISEVKFGNKKEKQRKKKGLDEGPELQKQGGTYYQN